MPVEIKLPALSESISEGVVSEVRVKAGDTLKPGDTVVVVEAEKSTVEVPAEAGGKVTEVLVKKGDTVKVGQVLARAEGGDGQPAADKGKKKDKAEAKAEAPEVPEGESPAAAKAIDGGATDAVDHARKTAAAVSHKPAVGGNGRNGEHDGPRTGDGAGLIPAGPATRRLARKLGVDLGQVPGTGPRGRVTQDDVIAFSKQLAPRESRGANLAAPPLPDFGKWGPVEAQPLELVRRKTAEQMTVAWSQVAHVTQHDLADVTDLETFRKSQEGSGPKLTVTAFALKAVAVALKEFPHFNASLDAAGGRLIKKGYYHIGVAVDTDRGLLVPVIRDVDKKSIRELAAEVAELAEKARQRKLPIDDMKGGTFTITNLGGIGGTAFTPIVNWPEVAILGLSRSRLEPAVRDGQVMPRLMLPLSLSYDHRVIDGADGARFTRRIAQMLEDPRLLLLDA
ncbi:MAG TPA: 2-oxo acid dehydrogenase subunit E2 [Gemmataceae bacterium]|jgi:pyruvate dehydrogenase E2 component (dihydrolipoamide acetyltransferase)